MGTWMIGDFRSTSQCPVSTNGTFCIDRRWGCRLLLYTSSACPWRHCGISVGCLTCTIPCKTNALIFLVDIYKEEYPWYFIVVLLRTASIAAVVVVFTSNVVLQLGFILLILMGAMVIHLRTVPFSLTRSNDLEVCAPETRT